MVSAAGDFAAGPIQTISSSWTTSAASGRMPSWSGPEPSQVTSSPIPVTTMLLTAPPVDRKRQRAAEQLRQADAARCEQ
jgi:hypothetical protein